MVDSLASQEDSLIDSCADGAGFEQSEGNKRQSTGGSIYELGATIEKLDGIQDEGNAAFMTGWELGAENPSRVRAVNEFLCPHCLHQSSTLTAHLEHTFRSVDVASGCSSRPRAGCVTFCPLSKSLPRLLHCLWFAAICRCRTHNQFDRNLKPVTASEGYSLVSNWTYSLAPTLAPLRRPKESLQELGLIESLTAKFKVCRKEKADIREQQVCGAISNHLRIYLLYKSALAPA